MKQRIITAFILIAIILPIILIGGIPFLVAITLLLAGAMYELTNVNKSPLITKIFTTLMVCCSSVYSYLNLDKPFANFNLLFVILPILGCFTIALFNKKSTLLDACYNSIITIILSLFAASLMELRNAFGNANLILYTFIVTTTVDTFALFIGSKFGKHKLNERISPKKSIEGSIGGIVGGTLCGVLFATFFPILTDGNINFLNMSLSENIIWINVLYTFLITLLLSVAGQIGDLIFSMIKRNYQIKDFSNLLPGHGGLADRIDSLCINSIVLSLILSLALIL